MNYRVYLFLAGHIRAAQTFSASNDMEAGEIAALLHEACSDVFEGGELWLGAKCLTKFPMQSGFRSPSLGEVVRNWQESLLDLEDTLQRTFHSIRTSRKLLESSAKLRDGLSHFS